MRSVVARHMTNLGLKMHHRYWFARLTSQNGKKDEHKLVRFPGVMVRKPYLLRLSFTVLLDDFGVYSMCSLQLYQYCVWYNHYYKLRLRMYLQAKT